ncbi:MAG: heme-copper oxidase subunit III [Anaerolineae bacterium]
MSAVTAPHEEHEHSHEPPFAQQLRANRLGLWLFCFSEIFLFAALLVARFMLWGNTRPELSQVLGLVATSVLLLSSFFVNRAESAMAHGDRKTFQSGMLIAAFLGTLFFIGVVFMEWNVFGLEGQIAGIELFGHLTPTDGVFGAVFFSMTGMHALHVLSGIIFLLIIWRNGRNGHFSAEKHWGVEAAAIYWHYVDVIWVFFYPALYLIGTAVH